MTSQTNLSQAYIAAEDIRWLNTWIDKTGWEIEHRSAHEFTDREYIDGQLVYEHTWYAPSDPDLEKYSLDEVTDIHYQLGELRDDAEHMNAKSESGQLFASRYRENLMSEIIEMRDKLRGSSKNYERTDSVMKSGIMDAGEYPESVRKELKANDAFMGSMVDLGEHIEIEEIYTEGGYVS